MTSPPLLNDIIHAARIIKGKELTYLLLLSEKGEHYRWYEESRRAFHPTSVHAETIPKALFDARKAWKELSFRTVHCGFRYTLPERDEHGENALFYQMVLSYRTPNGVYYDEELGHLCIVRYVSDEARDLWQRLENSPTIPVS